MKLSSNNQINNEKSADIEFGKNIKIIIEEAIKDPHYVNLCITTLKNAILLKKSVKNTINMKATGNALNDIGNLGFSIFDNIMYGISTTFTGTNVALQNQNISKAALQNTIKLWNLRKNKDPIIKYLLKTGLLEEIASLAYSAENQEKIQKVITQFFNSSDRKPILQKLGIDKISNIDQIVMQTSPLVINLLSYFHDEEKKPLKNLINAYLAKDEAGGKEKLLDETFKTARYFLEKGVMQNIAQTAANIEKLDLDETIKFLLETKKVKELKEILGLNELDISKIMSGVPLIIQIAAETSKNPKLIGNIEQEFSTKLSFRERIDSTFKKYNESNNKNKRKQLLKEIKQIKKDKKDNDVQFKKSLASCFENIVKNDALRENLTNAIENNKEIICKAIDRFIEKNVKFKNLNNKLNIETDKIYEMLKSGTSTKEGIESVIDYLKNPNSLSKKAAMIIKTQNITKVLNLAPKFIWAFFSGEIAKFKNHSLHPLNELAKKSRKPFINFKNTTKHDGARTTPLININKNNKNKTIS